VDDLLNLIFSRAHRIGQIRDVHIYRFISQVSFCPSLVAEWLTS
jgi:hypothetical protein